MGRSKIRTPEYWKQYWKDSALKNKEKRNSQNTNLQPLWAKDNLVKNRLTIVI